MRQRPRPCCTRPLPSCGLLAGCRAVLLSWQAGCTASGRLAAADAAPAGLRHAPARKEHTPPFSECAHLAACRDTTLLLGNMCQQIYVRSVMLRKAVCTPLGVVPYQSFTCTPTPTQRTSAPIIATAGPSARSLLMYMMLLNTFDSDQTSHQGCRAALMAMRTRAFQHSRTNNRRHKHAHRVHLHYMCICVQYSTDLAAHLRQA
jgi:hypothetical protein